MNRFSNEIKKQYLRESGISDLIEREESSANLSTAKMMCVLAAIYLMIWLMFALHLFSANDLLINTILPANAIYTVFWVILSYKTGGKPKGIKYLLMASLIVAGFMLNMLTGFKTWVFYAIPLLITCRYVNQMLTLFTYVLSIVASVFSAYANAYLLPKFGFIDLNMVSYSSGRKLDVTGWLFQPVISGGLEEGLVFRNSLLLMTLPNFVLLSFIAIICFMINTFGRRMMLDAQKIIEEKAKMELEISDNRSRIMISQIQPHFLYNALSAIMAIDGNPEQTVDALGEFGKYLRENLDVLTSEDLVSFSKEMQHVMRYVSLEKLRFSDKIEVEYNCPVKNFLLPPLTVQMLVENSIKHGVSKKAEGGLVRISTMENEKEFIIMVEDDGVGFTPEDIAPDRNHVGLENIKTRLHTLCGGSLDIYSVPGKGTRATVHIPKEG